MNTECSLKSKGATIQSDGAAAPPRRLQRAAPWGPHSS